jgi:polygalacturonase
MVTKKRLWSILLLFLIAGLFFFWRMENGSQEKTVSEVPEDEVISVPGIPERRCDIRDYGARAGSDTKSTEAIQAAIDDCSLQGGGTVVIPQGKWLSGGIKLKSHIHLFLTEGSELSFSTDLHDYLPVVFTRFQGIEFYNYAPLIYVKDSENIAITGKGKLIGNGDAREDWTGGGNFETAREHLYKMSRDGVPLKERVFGEKEPGLRPSFIQLVSTKDILLDGFTIENGPIWTIHPVYSENFVARNLHIDTWSGNTDGIVVDSTRNVVIEDSYFSTGDDAISIKSGLDEEGRRVARPSENIRIRNILVEKGSSGVSIGSEMSGGVTGVDIQDSVFRNTRHGFRIKSTKSRGGYIENVLVENVTLENTSGDALDINLSYTTELSSNASNKPIIKNILIRNIRGIQAERLVINIDGLPNSFVENVRFEDIFFEESARSVSLKSARNVVLKNIQIKQGEAKAGPTYEIIDSENIQIERSGCQQGIVPCVLVEGSRTKNIALQGVDFTATDKAVEVINGVRLEAVKIE